MTDLVPVSAGVDTTMVVAEDAWKLAQRIGRTEFVPKALRGKPEAVLAAILTGHELGIQPMNALAKIHVIDGRPSLSSEMMRAVILREGHEFHVEETTNTRCVVVGRRRESDRETRIAWTKDDASAAGLLGKDNWKKYPRAMLLARATGELARALFPDVLAGISYTSEEVRDGFEFDEWGEPVETETVEPPKPGKAKAAKKVTKAASKRQRPPRQTEPVAGRELPPLPGDDADEDEPDVEVEGDGTGETLDEYALPDDEIVDAEIIDDGPARSGPQQIAMMLGRKGINDRDQKLAICSAIVGRPIATSKDLTPFEVSLVLEAVSADDFDAAALMAQSAQERLSASPEPQGIDGAESGQDDESAEEGSDGEGYGRDEFHEGWEFGDWRSYLRRKKVKVTVAVAQASMISTDEFDGDAIEKLEELAENVEVGRALWERIEAR